jgi:hypothetical protein
MKRKQEKLEGNKTTAWPLVRNVSLRMSFVRLRCGLGSNQNRLRGHENRVFDDSLQLIKLLPVVNKKVI